MAKITDPDSLSIAVNVTATTEEVEVQTAAKTVELRVAGNLDDTSPGKASGVTGKAAYSFLKEEWLANPTLLRHRFPIKMIYEGSFIWVNGWGPANAQTRDLFRDAGFQEQVTGQENADIISLGPMVDAGADLGYFQQAPGFTAPTVVFDKTGEVNENIPILGPGGTPDNRSYTKFHLREPGKLFAEYDLIGEQGLASLTFQAYRLPLSNSPDIKVTTSDGDIATLAPYTGMAINFLKGDGFTTYATATAYAAEAVVFDPNVQAGGSSNGTWWFTPAGGTSSGANTGADVGIVDWEAYDGGEQIGTEWYAGNRILTANGGTKEESHEYAMWALRQTGDINANNTPSVNQRGFGVVNGEIAKLLTAFVGDTLKPAPGVIIRGFNANDTNDIVHSTIAVDAGGVDSEGVPVSSSEVSFPLVAAGNFNFSANIVAEPDANTVYTAYHNYAVRVTASDIAISGAAGDTAVIGWSGTTLDHVLTGNWLRVSGFADANNNGNWEITGAVDTGANTASATKRDRTNAPVNEVAGPSVTVDQSPFDTPGAIIVTDNSAVDMDGQVTSATISWDFDYTNNSDGGRVPGVDAPITVVALSTTGAEWIEAAHTITGTTGQNIAINPGDDLNYDNPA